MLVLASGGDGVPNWCWCWQVVLASVGVGVGVGVGVNPQVFHKWCRCWCWQVVVVALTSDFRGRQVCGV